MNSSVAASSSSLLIIKIAKVKNKSPNGVDSNLCAILMSLRFARMLVNSTTSAYKASVHVRVFGMLDARRKSSVFSSIQSCWCSLENTWVVSLTSSTNLQLIHIVLIILLLLPTYTVIGIRIRINKDGKQNFYEEEPLLAHEGQIRY